MNRILAWGGLITTFLLSLLSLVQPMVILNPEREQTAEILSWAYWGMRWAPVGVPLLFLVALVLTVYLWRNPRFPRSERVLASLLVLLLGAGVWLSQQNIPEWIFQPLPDAGFIHVDEVDYLEDTDMILSVRIGDKVRGFPVRIVGYHHIVHSELEGVAFVATY